MKNKIDNKIDQLEEKMNSLESTLVEIKNALLEGKVVGENKNVGYTVGNKNNRVVSKYESLSSSTRAKIDNIMHEFDFYKVHKVMELLQWVWITCGENGKAAVPTVGHMKAEAKRLLIEAAYEKTNIATGGFKAVYETTGPDDDDPYIGLEFIVEDGEGFVEDT